MKLKNRPTKLKKTEFKDIRRKITQNNQIKQIECNTNEYKYLLFKNLQRK